MASEASAVPPPAEPVPMSKDICCENFKGLIAYIRNHFGAQGVEKLTAGLVDGPFCVRDKYDPQRIVPIGLTHLTDPDYWVSNEFSLKLLGSVHRVVPGPTPLYTAGMGMVQESLSRTTLFVARLIGIKGITRKVARINARFNRTKDVAVLSPTDASLTFELRYRPGFRVTKDVCNWNLGIYAGIGRLTGIKEIVARETACVVDGAPCCRFHLSWERCRSLGALYRMIRDGLIRWQAKDLIADYERSLEERGALIDRLERSEKKYRTLFEDSLEALSLTRRGRLLDVNPAWLRLHGFEARNEVLGREVIDFVHPEDRPLLTERRRRYHHPRPGGLRIRDVRSDGSVIDVEVYSSRIEYDGAESILATVRDITEMKRAEAKRQQLEARLQRAEKMEAVAALAGGVAHDLNNVLSGIVGYPDLILMQLPDDSPLVPHIRTMRETGKKAAAIVQDLLTLARRGVSIREVLNLNTIVAQYLDSPEYRKMLSYHPGVRIESRLAPDLLNMNGSPIHLAKTLMNLVSNAAEAMPQGGSITVATANRYVDQERPGYEEVPEGVYCVLEVKDTGIGIAPEDQEKIFEPFFTKKAMGRSGTGLGMAVVWGTVQDHEGFIRLDSAPDRGTTFRLFFPATRTAAAGQTARPEPTIQGRGEIILVVDDMQAQREVAGQMLTAMGYASVLVDSGEAALAYLEHHRCDLVLLDMIMPGGMDGLETYRLIVQRYPGQKAVIASGFSETDRVRQTQALGAGAYLAKPYTMESLGRSVRAELDRAAPPAAP